MRSARLAALFLVRSPIYNNKQITTMTWQVSSQWDSTMQLHPTYSFVYLLLPGETLTEEWSACRPVKKSVTKLDDVMQCSRQRLVGKVIAAGRLRSGGNCCPPTYMITHTLRLHCVLLQYHVNGSWYFGREYKHWLSGADNIVVIDSGLNEIYEPPKYTVRKWINSPLS